MLPLLETRRGYRRDLISGALGSPMTAAWRRILADGVYGDSRNPRVAAYVITLTNGR
jgi:hypothetical protein